MLSLNTTFLAVLYFLLINIIAFGAFAWDKSCARNGSWRISENTLLMIAVFGGTIGSLLGQKIIRHKTRKQPFASLLLAIVFLHIFTIVGFSIFVLTKPFVS